jgi:hypothetical protein
VPDQNTLPGEQITTLGMNGDLKEGFIEEAKNGKQIR